MLCPQPPAITQAWYLAGPMSGIPQFNYPAFFKAARVLRNVHDLIIISPAEQDGYEKLKMILASDDGDLSTLPDVGTWADFLAHDVKIISEDVTGIVFMPGWQASKGARLEAYIGLMHDHDFACYDEHMGMYALSRKAVIEEIYISLLGTGAIAA